MARTGNNQYLQKCWKGSILLLLALTIYQVSPAQQTLGLRIQPAATNLEGFAHVHIGGRIGPGFTWRFAPKWDLITGLGYMTMANRTQTTTFGNGHDITVTTAINRLHAVGLEALTGFWPHERIRVSAGIYAAFIFYAGRKINFVFTDNGTETENSIRGNQTALYRQLDYGIRANLAYRVSQSIDIQLFFSQGLRQLSVLDAFQDVNERPQMLGLGMDWNFILSSH